VALASADVALDLAYFRQVALKLYDSKVIFFHLRDRKILVPFLVVAEVPFEP
jgi:hypothetical protein